MNGLEQVKDAISAALEKAGVRTQTAYAPEWAKAYSEPVVAVGLRTGESRGGALSSYLGQRMDPRTQVCQEVYGMRLELTAGGEGVLETLHQIMLEGLPTGLRPMELKWEEALWDAGTAMFLRRGSLACSACFIAAVSEDGAVFSDFILKGVVEK